MKQFYLTAIITAILFICTSGIQAQTKPISPANTNQIKLIKQLHSNQPPEIKQSFDANKNQLPQGFENLQNPEILKTEKANQLKSTMTNNLKLDSMITEYWNKNTHKWHFVLYQNYLDLNGTYFNSKNINIRNSLYPSRPISNEVYTRQLFNYDVNGILIGSTYYGWGLCYSQVGEPIPPQFKTESVYDINGNVTLLNSYFLVSYNEYVFMGREEYSYDENCKKKLNFPYHFNHAEYHNYKKEFTFDANGNKTLFIYLHWDELKGEWITDQKIEYEYEYDSNGNIILQNNYYSDESWWSRSPEETTKYIYDANGKMTSQSLDLWWKYEYTWDANGNMTTRNYYTWDESKSTWNLQDTLMWKYTYDSIGNMTSQSFDSKDEKWKYEYTYDTNANKTREIFYPWNNSIADWGVADTRTTWYYSDHTATSILNTTTPNLTVYPNPAKDLVLFDLPNSSGSATVELYDIQGKKVIQQKLTETRQLAVGQLPKGLYLYRLTDSETFYTGKLVVE